MSLHRKEKNASLRVPEGWGNPFFFPLRWIATAGFAHLVMTSMNLHAHSSLFFTQDEINTIHKISPLKQNLHLSSLLYIDDMHWAVWINGECIRPENRHDLENFKIEKVIASNVTIKCDNSSKTLTLRPNETVICSP